MWKPYLKFITKRFLDIIPHTESSSSFPSFSFSFTCSPAPPCVVNQPSEQPRKFKIIDFRLGFFKFMLKNAFLFMFVSSKREEKCSLSPSHLSTSKFARNRKTKFGNKKNQTKVTAESERAGKQHWAVENYRREQKQSRKVQFLSLCVFWHRTKKFYNKKASLSKVHLKVFRKAQQKNSPDLTVSVRFSPFSILLKQKKLCRRCVRQPENVYNHLKYITVE